tara:strand:+ start:2817 stop:4283 length:1467 start_codon:yes stop_codon:yes gene_type:complete
MGFLRKIGRKIGKGIRKLGRKIKKGLKGIVKGIGKLGVLGTIAMMFVMPYVPVLWTNLGTFASGLTTSSSVLAKAAGYAMKGVYHAGRLGGKVYSTVTNAITGTLSKIPGVSNISEAVAKTFNKAIDFTKQKLGIQDPTALYSEASLDFKEFQNIAGENASLKDFEAWKQSDNYASFKSINTQGKEFYQSMVNEGGQLSETGTFGKTDALRKNESFDDFLERNNMEADRFLELNDNVTTSTTVLEDGSIVETPELVPQSEYNVVPSEKEVIGQVRRARLDGRSVDLDYNVDEGMYKIQTDYDKYIRQGMTPEEANLELNRQYQAKFGDEVSFESDFKGYARDGSSGAYFKQDADLLESGKQGMDAVKDMTIVTPESDPGFFRSLATKAFSQDSITDVTANVAQKGVQNELMGLITPSSNYVPQGVNTYSPFNKQSVTSNDPLDTGSMFMQAISRVPGLGYAQMNAYNTYENTGYGGNLPSFVATGYGR